MEMEDATVAPEPAELQEGERAQLQPHARIDWRTGRPMQVHGAAFWKAHEARRVEQGLSVAAYCEANGLAKSTFRRHASVGDAGTREAPARAGAQPSRFVPLGASAAKLEPVSEAMTVEIETGDGLKLRLAGAAADRLVQHMLARLA